MKWRAPIIFLIFLCFVKRLHAQDIDAIIHRDILAASGAI
jgi:hypothetical protein